jgi:polysaccharide pyruvyl transferase WcaK-like protein
MAGAVDQEFVTSVSSAVIERAGRPPRIEPLPIAPSKAVGRLAEFDAVVSMRLHGVILAAVAETPCVPISYDAKVENVAARLGLSEVAVPLNEVSAAVMQSRLQVVQQSALRAEVQERTDELRGQMRDARRLVESAAGC